MLRLVWILLAVTIQVKSLSNRDARFLDLATRPRQGRQKDNTGQSINRRSCRVAGETGTCMFVWECLKTEGKHLGMCMDGFMFGSCCVHNEDQNKVEDNKVKDTPVVTETITTLETSTTSSRPPERPTRPSRPSKPSHHPVKWPNFHLVEQKISKPGSEEEVDKIDLVKKPSSSHFLSVKSPEDPRPNLPKPTRLPFPDRKPTVSWSWEKKKPTVTTTTVSEITTSKSYFPSSQSTPSQQYLSTIKPLKTVKPSNDTPLTVVKNGPTRPTRPPKPSTLDLVTYFPPLLEKPTPVIITTTTATTTTQRTTTRITTKRTTVTTTTTTTVKPVVVTRPKPSKTAKPRPQQPRGGGCGLPQKSESCPKGRIVNGTQSCYGQFPWQVSVRRTSFFGFSSTHRCGGALINELWVATAGHCVDDLLLPKIRVRIGEWDFSSTSEPQSHVERKIQEKIVHPKYNFFTYEYDIALLKLEKRVDFHENIIPICLPGNDDLLIGEMGIVAGWGRLSEGGQLPSILQYVSVPIVSNDKCKSMFLRAGRHEVIPEIFMCAGYDHGGRDSCQGDSGGPLVVKGKDGRWFLGGIISWGIGCAEPNLPGVCTRISKFTDWILSIVT